MIPDGLSTSFWRIILKLVRTDIAGKIPR